MSRFNCLIKSNHWQSDDIEKGDVLLSLATDGHEAGTRVTQVGLVIRGTIGLIYIFFIPLEESYSNVNSTIMSIYINKNNNNTKKRQANENECMYRKQLQKYKRKRKRKEKTKQQ